MNEVSIIDGLDDINEVHGHSFPFLQNSQNILSILKIS